MSHIFLLCFGFGLRSPYRLRHVRGFAQRAALGFFLRHAAFFDIAQMQAINAALTRVLEGVQGGTIVPIEQRDSKDTLDRVLRLGYTQRQRQPFD